MIAYINGQFVAEEDAVIPVRDRGFMLGDGIFDTWRTYGTRAVPAVVSKHVKRMSRSINYLELDGPELAEELGEAAGELVVRNREDIETVGDVMVYVAVSRGLFLPPPVGAAPLGFTVGLPTRVAFLNPIPFQDNGADLFDTGVHLVPSIQSTSPFGGYDPRVKSLSRLAFVRAERKQYRVRTAMKAGAAYWTILFDDQGFIAECAGGALCIVEGDTIVHPPLSTILPSISLEIFCELAQQLGFGVIERRLSAFDFLNADGAYLLSTSVAALPVADLDGVPLARRDRVGPAVQRAWIDLVDFDFVEQTRKLGG